VIECGACDLWIDSGDGVVDFVPETARAERTEHGPARLGLDKPGG
jgi:hypothetical protein